MKKPFNLLSAFILLSSLCVALPSHAKSETHENILVFAASSLAPVLENIGSEFTKETGIEVRFSFASSAILARQIKQGAPADIFISADENWQNWLNEHFQTLQPPIAIAGNQIILAATKNLQANKQDNLNLDTLLNESAQQQTLIAIADPKVVPLGRYTNESLVALKQLNIFKPHLIETNSAQATLRFLKSGAVSLAIIYKSDLTQNPDLQEIYAFPAASHRAIIYMANIVKVEKYSSSPAFMNYLISPEAQAIFLNYGFERNNIK